MARTRTIRRCHRRKGTIYVTVLVVTVAVVLMTTSAMGIARLHLRSLQGEQDRHAARLLALSAIDLALVKFNNEPAWETTYNFNVEYPTIPVKANGGSFTWRLVNEGNGKKRLDGIGRVGDASYVQSVDLGVETPDLLSFPMLVGGDLWIGNSSSHESLTAVGGMVACNGDLKNWNTLYGDIEAQTESVVGAVSGTKVIPGTLRKLPAAEQILEYYMDQGTVLSNASLPGNGDIKNIILSPNSNPYGPTDPNGLYIIDSFGADLKIESCRIVGTLLIINPGYKTTIKEPMNWEPARLNWPALLLEGDLIFEAKGEGEVLSEGAANFNSTGTPWKGNSDSDTDDVYPNALAGIFYNTGGITFDKDGSTEIEGVVICEGSVLIKGKAKPEITYDATAVGDPPPGFGPGDASSIVTGTWRQSESP